MKNQEKSHADSAARSRESYKNDLEKSRDDSAARSRPLNFEVAETVRLKEDFPFQYPHATTTKVLNHGAHLHEGSKMPTSFGHARTTP